MEKTDIYTSFYTRYMKRSLDIVCSLLAILVFSWLYLIIALLVRWKLGSPILFTQLRPGKDERIFKMYKFRSMRVAKAATEASLRPDEDRIFPFGHFIRKVKVDELPQLLNILNGTMSIIGPRPVAQDQFGMFRYGKWNEAAKVPVGLSGPAALYDFIYGDQITDEKEYMEKVYPTRRELEYTYVQKAGIFYDLKMIVYTVVCILYAVCGKECTWMLNEFVEDAKMTMDK